MVIRKSIKLFSIRGMKAIQCVMLGVIFILHSELFSEEFRVGYYPHYQIDKFKQLIEKSYQDIGINVTFIEIPVAERSSTELAAGRIDAEVLRTKITAQKLEKMLIIEPPIMVATMYLVCRTGLSCLLEVLQSEEITVMGTAAVFKLLPAEILSAMRAKRFVNHDIESLYKMIDARRFDYAIVSTIKGTKPQFNIPYTITEISKYPMHHIVHEKHAHLTHALSKAIQVNIKQIQ